MMRLREETMVAIIDVHLVWNRRSLSLIAALLGVLAWLAFALSSDARADESTGGFVDLPNVKLWVTDTGGPGDPVILLHANTGTTENWQKQTPFVAQAGYRVIAFDRPGWGKSIVDPGVKPISAAENLDALADHLKLNKFHLVGVAGGGYIALDYAAWHPERLNSLVLAATGLGLRADEEATTFRSRAAIPGFSQLPSEVRE
jgi:pimeloyl-ACP methyl ester carboxylesterase